jgi:hypothetical protein
MSSKHKHLSDTCALDLNSVVELVSSSVSNSDPKARIHDTHSAEQAGALLDLVSREMLFLRDSSTRPSLIIPNLMVSAGFNVSAPFNKAAFALSLAIENRQENQPSYHNERHAIEVAVASCILGRRQKLPQERLAELILAATAHDLGHEGKNNESPFEWEDRAVRLMTPILKKAGLGHDNIHRVSEMIRGTDFKNGVPRVKEEFRNTRELAAHDERRLLAMQRLLLVEADVFFSCFDLTYNQILSRLLSIEWNRPGPNLKPAERIGFLSSVEFISNAALELGLEERRKSILESLKKLDAA